MRSVHFRVSDGMYVLIQQGAEEEGASVANFCREAARRLRLEAGPTPE